MNTDLLVKYLCKRINSDMPTNLRNWLYPVLASCIWPIATLLITNMAWSLLESSIPYSFEKNNYTACILLWIFCQICLRINGLINAVLWPSLCNALYQHLLNLGIYDEININKYIEQTHSLLLNVINGIVIPGIFAGIAISTLFSHNLLIGIISTTWLIGHLTIYYLSFTKIMSSIKKLKVLQIFNQKSARTVFQKNSCLAEKDHKNLIEDRKALYKLALTSNLNVELVITAQSIWLAICFIYCLLCTQSSTKLSAMLLWLNLSHQIWYLGNNWISILQNTANLIAIIKE